MPTHLAGIDLGGTNIQVAIIERDAEAGEASARILAREKRKTKPLQGADAVIARLAEAVTAASAVAGIEPAQLTAIGIGAPGAIDPQSGSVLVAPNLRWRDEPLASKLGALLNLPVVVENDVNAAVYAEARLGAGRSMRNILGVWLGTGVGGGLILNGQLHHGHFFSAGEIGHMPIQPANPPDCQILEHLCSRTAIAERIARMIRQGKASTPQLTSLVENNAARIKSSAIASAFAEGDPLTLEVLRDASSRLGLCLAGLQTLLSLECVILGGGLTEAIGQPLADWTREAMAPRVFPPIAGQIPVLVTELKDDAGALGAALLAEERLLLPHSTSS